MTDLDYLAGGLAVFGIVIALAVLILVLCKDRR